MRLAEAGADQAPVMARLHALAFENPWTAAAFTSLLEGTGVFALVAEAEGPCGLILCRAVAREAEILTLGVTPQARRNGIARALVVGALAIARRAQAETMFLEVGAENLSAVGLYSQLGFVETGRRQSYYARASEGREDALVMRLDLTASAG